MSSVATMKKRIQRNYSKTRLTEMFVHRLADQMFAEVGAVALGAWTAKKADPHILVWTGYEIVTDSVRAAK